MAYGVGASVGFGITTAYLAAKGTQQVRYSHIDKISSSNLALISKFSYFDSDTLKQLCH